jgi:hypothetical protein
VPVTAYLGEMKTSTLGYLHCDGRTWVCLISWDEKNIRVREDIQKMLTRVINNFSRIILIVRWSAIGTRFFHATDD